MSQILRDKFQLKVEISQSKLIRLVLMKLKLVLKNFLKLFHLARLVP